jgi:hypothetical protein
MHGFGLDIEEMERLIEEYLSDGLQAVELRKNEILKLPSSHRIFLLNQIELADRASHKFPSPPIGARFIIPSRLAVEQASSIDTANHKATLISQLFPDIQLYIDITGGLGGDFMAVVRKIHPGLTKAVYLEQDTELFMISKCNINLYLNNTSTKFEFHNVNSLHWIRENINSLNSSECLIFADPARRSKSGGKLYKISDCSPDVAELRKLLPKANHIFKLSPMLDISQALRELDNISLIQIIEHENEVKELLAICKPIDYLQNEKHPQITYISLDSGASFSYRSHEFSDQLSYNDPQEGSYLYIPRPGISKAAAGDRIVARLGFSKIAPNTNIYFQTHFEKKAADFFRIFSVRSLHPYKKNELLEGESLNIIPKNFPDKASLIAKKMGIKEGGRDFLICYRKYNSKPQVALCNSII